MLGCVFLCVVVMIGMDRCLLLLTLDNYPFWYHVQVLWGGLHWLLLLSSGRKHPIRLEILMVENDKCVSNDFMTYATNAFFSEKK